MATGAGATPYAALQELCAAMSPDPLLPAQPVVGCNNWYYAYGRDFGPDAVLRDAAAIAEFAGDHPGRPFCVVDDGWTEGGGSAPGPPWDTGLPGLFDEMTGLAAGIAEAAGNALVLGCNAVGHHRRPRRPHGLARDHGPAPLADGGRGAHVHVVPALGRVAAASALGGRRRP